MRYIKKDIGLEVFKFTGQPVDTYPQWVKDELLKNDPVSTDILVGESASANNGWIVQEDNGELVLVSNADFANDYSPAV